MSFLFASSHLPEEKHSQKNDEEEDYAQPMRWSGSVRAFSHLPQPVPRTAAAPRPPVPVNLPTVPGAGAGLEPVARSGGVSSGGLPAADDTRPWHQPPITLADLPPESHAEQEPNPGFGGPAPGGQSASHGTSSFAPSPQDIPNSDTDATAAEVGPGQGKAPQCQGLWFKSRLPPGFRNPAAGKPVLNDLVYRQPPQDANSPAPSPPRSPSDPAQFHDLVYRTNGSPAEVKEHTQSLFQNVAAVHGAAPQLAASAEATAPSPARNPEQESQSSEKAIPSTTIRIGNYPAFEKLNASQKEIDEWNTTFRDTYGKLAADAARKHGVPARLLAALSANEVAAPNWNALNAFADRNTLLTKSVGPLQISAKTALKYKLVPIDNEFYGLPQSDIWAAMHDPDLRYAGQSPSHAPDAQHQAPARDLPAFTPGQNLLLRRTPYPTSIYDPNGTRVIHDYLDNPATSFDAGAKLLKIYLGRLVDDYKSGAYLKYSKDFRDLCDVSSPADPVYKDLNTLASGDKDAIHNLHFSPGLARALAMMWNNGEDIVNVKDIFNQSPNAHAHGYNMQSQQVHQDDLIPRD